MSTSFAVELKNYIVKIITCIVNTCLMVTSGSYIKRFRTKTEKLNKSPNHVSFDTVSIIFHLGGGGGGEEKELTPNQLIQWW